MNGRDLLEMYPKGCPRPMGYADFFDWAKAQKAHGLKQAQCRRCLLWTFPQETCDCAHLAIAVRLLRPLYECDPDIRAFLDRLDKEQKS